MDPVRAPLIREAFELYASGRYTLDTLLTELRCRGLTTRSGTRLTRRSVADILHNSFYTGIIQIRRTGQTFDGKHTPIIQASLFRAVQNRLSRRIRSTKWVHDFLFRGLFQCSLCRRMMTGEARKGHVYYRCHTSGCPTRGFREEALETALLECWPALAETEEEIAQLRRAFDDFLTRSREHGNAIVADLKMQLAATKDRHNRLVDAFVDGHVDKETFEVRKGALLHTQRELEERIRDSSLLSADNREVFELALSAHHLYAISDTAARRELVLRMSLTRTVAGKTISVELHPVLARMRVGLDLPTGDETPLDSPR